MSKILLARYAEAVFWLARYVERIENLARILDVNETFARDSRGGQNWASIVDLNGDMEGFGQIHPRADAESVLAFYLLDGDNPTSIPYSVRKARDNARMLRPLISTEMWVHLNVFHNRMKALDPGQLTRGNRTKLFAWIKEACQTHTGITEGTFYRDQGWCFYRLGRYLERADQTTRLLDIKYHLLLPEVSDVGSPIDISQWNALLRSAAGYHAFRRLHAGALTPARVVGFMLLSRRFPRSVALCLQDVANTLHEVCSVYSLRGGGEAGETLDETLSMLDGRDVEEILTLGLHEFLDLLQRRTGEITRQLGTAFFGYRTGMAEKAIVLSETGA